MCVVREKDFGMSTYIYLADGGWRWEKWEPESILNGVWIKLVTTENEGLGKGNLKSRLELEKTTRTPCRQFEMAELQGACSSGKWGWLCHGGTCKHTKAFRLELVYQPILNLSNIWMPFKGKQLLRLPLFTFFYHVLTYIFTQSTNSLYINLLHNPNKFIS